MIIAQIIARVYLLKYLDQPARYKGAPWYVNLSFNSGMVNLFDLKETVLFYFIGFIGFIVVFIINIDHIIIGSLFTILFLLGVWMYWKAMVWMDKNDRWGTRKPKVEEDNRSTLQHLTKDSFLLFNSIVVVFLILVTSFLKIDNYLQSRGYEDGKKDALEQIRQDSLQNFKNK